MSEQKFLCKNCNTDGVVTTTKEGIDVSPCFCQTVANTDYDPMCGCATCAYERDDVKVSLGEVVSFINSDAMWEMLVHYDGKYDPEHGTSRTMTFIANAVVKHFITE